MNYNTLRNKPTINYRELIGDSTVSEVGGITEEEFNDLLDTDLSSYYTKAQIDDLFSRSFVYREKSGSIVTFDCPTTTNGIAQVTSEIVAVQSGSGDPSPTNIRPITGWSAVNVARTGKNLFGGTYDNIYSLYIPKSTQITLSTKAPQVPYSRFAIYDKDQNLIDYWAINTVDSETGRYYRTFSFSVDVYYVKFYYSPCEEMQIKFETDVTYEPYNGTTYTTALKDGQGNPMTCYGGTLTNVNGVQSLDNTKDMVDLGTLNWTAQTDSQGTYFRSSKPNGMKAVQSGVIPNALCSIYPTTTSSNVYDGSIAFSVGSEGYTFVRDTRFTDATSFKTAMNGVQLVYELATPQQIPQDSLSIATQEGINNIWCDSGDITVKALDRIIQG